MRQSLVILGVEVNHCLRRVTTVSVPPSPPTKTGPQSPPPHSPTWTSDFIYNQKIFNSHKSSKKAIYKIDLTVGHGRLPRASTSLYLDCEPFSTWGRLKFKLQFKNPFKESYKMKKTLQRAAPCAVPIRKWSESGARQKAGELSTPTSSFASHNLGKHFLSFSK